MGSASQDLGSASQLGFKNEQLLKFGIPPRRKPSRRKAEEETPTENPPETSKAKSTPQAKRAE